MHCGRGPAATLALLAAVLLAACVDQASTGAAAEAMADLPLQPGFFVASDTPCERASNATLLLKRPGGINGSHDYCDFTSVEQTGPHSYRVSEACGEFQGDAASVAVQHTDWEIPDERNFHSRGDGGWQRDFRHCEQASLPQPWRDNDIGD